MDYLDWSFDAGFRFHGLLSSLAKLTGDLAPHVRARLGIEAGGRLIQEQHLRLVDESHRHVELALHVILGIVRFGKKSAQFLRHPFRLAASIGIAIGIA